jgi:hypothetical protein
VLGRLLHGGVRDSKLSQVYWNFAFLPLNCPANLADNPK